MSYDTESLGCDGGNFAGDFMVKNGLVLDSACPYTEGQGCPSGQPTTFAASGRLGPISVSRVALRRPRKFSRPS